MANLDEAQQVWERALGKADGDQATAQGILLAAILHEVEDQSSRMQAVADAMEKRLRL